MIAELLAVFNRLPVGERRDVVRRNTSRCKTRGSSRWTLPGGHFGS
jgi:hypothetical protein